MPFCTINPALVYSLLVLSGITPSIMYSASDLQALTISKKHMTNLHIEELVRFDSRNSGR